MAVKHVELNDRGQVTLPADVREFLGLVKDDELEVEIGSGGIVLLRTEPRRLTGEEQTRITRTNELLAKRNAAPGSLTQAETKKLSDGLHWMRAFELELDPRPTYRPPGDAPAEKRSYVTLSPRGQVTLPMKQRRAADLREGDRFTLTVGGGMLVLVPGERRLTAREQEAWDRLNALCAQDETTDEEEKEKDGLIRWANAAQLPDDLVS